MQSLKENETLNKAYVSYPEKQQGQAIILVHAWWGLNNFFKKLADRIAN